MTYSRNLFSLVIQGTGQTYAGDEPGLSNQGREAQVHDFLQKLQVT